jgi:hypothetical protein
MSCGKSTRINNIEAICDHCGYGGYARSGCPSCYKQYIASFKSLNSQINALQADNKQLRAALEEITSWSKAYPLEVFTKPDLKKAHEVLKANGMTLDAISAAAMRHVVKGVGKIAAEALKDKE